MEELKNIFFLILLVINIGMSSCKKAGVNSSGSEYMPGMYHSIAYEANYNTYYDRNQWASREEYWFYAKPRVPVKGTIPRDYSFVGNTEFNYGDTGEEKKRAIREITKSPIELTSESLWKGKKLYRIYCSICHGETGNGEGFLVRGNGGTYPAMPTNLLSEEMMKSSDGRYYYSIMKGQNMMEPFYDKLDYIERWQVIQYIRELQKNTDLK